MPSHWSVFQFEGLEVFQVRLPLPFRLDHVFCYVVNSGGTWWIVDSGLGIPEAKELWDEFVKDVGIRWERIRGVYVTHYHPDHCGLVEWLQERSGARCFISATEAELVRIYWMDKVGASEAMVRLFLVHGMPARLAQDAASAFFDTAQYVYPRARFSVLEAGRDVAVGRSNWSIVLAPGHSPGHLCFYNRRHGILISGDFLLPRISPNVGFWPFGEVNPLRSYLQSLWRVSLLDGRWVFPGHGQVFNEIRGRVRELLAHHETRLARMKELVGSGATAFEVSQQVFGGDLSLHEMRFAMAETLAHLLYLVYLGRLSVAERGGCFVFK